MKENIEEVIEFLQGFNDGYTFQQCRTCSKFNEEDVCCNKEKCDELEALEFLISEYRRVLKENKELKKELDRVTDGRNQLFEYATAQQANPEMLHKVLRVEYIPKQKVKDKIEELESELEFEITEREAKIQINLLKTLLWEDKQ